MLTTLPPWLVLPARDSAPLREMERLLGRYRLHTVCESADCPNQLECFAHGTCTFMILGDVCTRGCRFCAVDRGRPRPPDCDEPTRIAAMVRDLGFTHVVITSVTRDDLVDGGASQFVATVYALREVPGVTIELLVPDFAGSAEALDQVLAARPEVLAHNLETVPRLYPTVRPGADYERSLDLVTRVASSASVSKCGLILGLGETLQEVVGVLLDLRKAGCQVVTLGQYLRPSGDCRPVSDYRSPAVFAALRRRALAMGFRACMAGPLVRSSYRAETTVCTSGVS